MGPHISALEYAPFQISILRLDHLKSYGHNSHVEYLLLYVESLHNPSEGGWDNYQTILSFFPNLKGICFLSRVHHVCSNFSSFYPTMSSVNKNIWEERIVFFKSKNIIIGHECLVRISQLQEKPKSKVSWYFNHLDL